MHWSGIFSGGEILDMTWYRTREDLVYAGVFDAQTAQAGGLWRQHICSEEYLISPGNWHKKAGKGED